MFCIDGLVSLALDCSLHTFLCKTGRVRTPLVLPAKQTLVILNPVSVSLLFVETSFQTFFLVTLTECSTKVPRKRKEVGMSSQVRKSRRSLRSLGRLLSVRENDPVAASSATDLFLNLPTAAGTFFFAFHGFRVVVARIQRDFTKSHEAQPLSSFHFFSLRETFVSLRMLKCSTHRLFSK
jgi:hypothetical protein